VFSSLQLLESFLAFLLSEDFLHLDDVGVALLEGVVAEVALACLDGNNSGLFNFDFLAFTELGDVREIVTFDVLVDRFL
jgi:hypothetical protein